MSRYTGTVNQIMDTHTIVKELVAEGMPEKQAEAIVFFQARLFDERVATKQDIDGVKKDIDLLRVEVKKDIDDVKKDIDLLRVEVKKDIDDVKKDIDLLRVEVKKDIDGVKKDIDGLRTDVKRDIDANYNKLIVRCGGMLVAAVGVLAALQAF